MASDVGAGEFGEAAGRLAGMAAVIAGWSPAAFWAATPAELAGVVRALSGGEAGAAAPVNAATLRAMREACPDG